MSIRRQSPASVFDVRERGVTLLGGDRARDLEGSRAQVRNDNCCFSGIRVTSAAVFSLFRRCYPAVFSRGFPGESPCAPRG